MGEAYEIFRQQIVPPTFLIFFTVITQVREQYWKIKNCNLQFCIQVLVWVARPDLEFDLLGSLTSFGNPFAWKVVLSFYTWALLSQKVPGSKTFCGPPAPHGFIPEYAANGFQYYFCTLGAFLALIFVYPDFCLHVYEDFGPIVQVPQNSLFWENTHTHSISRSPLILIWTEHGLLPFIFESCL